MPHDCVGQTISSWCPPRVCIHLCRVDRALPVFWSSRGGTGTLPPPPSSNRAGGFPAHGLPEFDRSQGMRRQSTTSRSKRPVSQTLQVGIKRLPFRNPVGAVAPTLQVTLQSLIREPVQFAERL